MISVSAYIPVYNGALYLEETIQSLLYQTTPFAEIIVVDDGSQDASYAIAEKYPLRILRHIYNKGIGAARNTAIRACANDFIAAIDADCVLAPDWLEKCIAQFTHPGIGGVGGKLLETEIKSIFDKWRAINLIQHFGEGTKEVSYLSGSNTVFRKTSLLKAGLYNEHRRSHHEDTELSSAVRDNGYLLIYCAEAVAYHNKHDTWYSVMRSCWGFRHDCYPASGTALIKDIGRECCHAVSIMLKSLIALRVMMLLVDASYFFIQSLFSIKSYFLKTENFK